MGVLVRGRLDSRRRGLLALGPTDSHTGGMHVRILFPMLAMAALTADVSRAADAAVPNRSPLQPNAYNLLPLGSVMPRGWLLEQLRLQAQGLSGHLDEFWPDLGADSA